MNAESKLFLQKIEHIKNLQTHRYTLPVIVDDRECEIDFATKESMDSFSENLRKLGPIVTASNDTYQCYPTVYFTHKSGQQSRFMGTVLRESK